MELADRATPVKFLIRDRDTKFVSSFDAVFAAEAIRIINIPVRVRRPNVIAERFVGTIRRECLDRMLILGWLHLEAALGEYVEHYNRHLPHRALSQRAPSNTDATRLRSATSAARTSDEPMSWAASSMSIAGLHDLGGSIVGTHRSRHELPRRCRRATLAHTRRRVGAGQTPVLLVSWTVCSFDQGKGHAECAGDSSYHLRALPR